MLHATLTKSLLLVAAIGLVACGAPRPITKNIPQEQTNSSLLAFYASGRVGCPPTEIKISNLREARFTREVGFVRARAQSWTARCRGKTFYCSLSTRTIACAPSHEGAGLTR